MRRQEISVLIQCLSEKYGDRYSPWGTAPDEEEGTGFRIQGIPATFSVICNEEVPNGIYDFQIESWELADYTHPNVPDMDSYMCNGQLDLTGFLSLVESYERPFREWPV
jgi:hypothetical protein